MCMNVEDQIERKKHRWPKIVGFSFLGLTLVLVAILVAANMYAKRSLPQI